MKPATIAPHASQHANRALLIKLGIVVSGMFLFAFALVPLYNVFCDITGLNGKPSLTPATIATPSDSPAGGAAPSAISIKLITHLQGNLNISMTAEQPTISTPPGKMHQVDFIAHNPNNLPIVIRAVPSVSPGLAAKHLQKFECFCFQQQHLAAGETKTMGLSFTIDPSIDQDFQEITISYAIFDISHEVL